jgi:hypothetical protein
LKRTTRNFSLGLMAAYLSACGHQDGTSAAGSNVDAAVAAARSSAAAHASATAVVKTAAPIIDACALVSLADAESVLGTSARLAEHAQDDKYVSHCQFDAVDQARGFNSLMIEINSDDSATEAATGMAMHRQMYASDAAASVYHYEVLSGVGDEAFLATNKVPEAVLAQMPDMLQDQQMLFFIKGARDCNIIASYSGKPRSNDNLKALAQKLARRF